MSEKAKEKPVAVFLSKRSQDALQLQQIITYLIGTCLVMVGMSLHLFNVLGSKMPMLRLLSVVVMFVCAVTFVLWLFRIVSVTRAFTFTSFIVLAVQTAKILYISLAMPPEYSFLALINGIISMMLMTMLAISYLRSAAIIVGIVNVGAMVYAGMVMHQRIVWQFVIVIILFTVFFIFMADMMYRNVKRIHIENKQYHSDEQRLLHTLRLNRNEIRAYIKLCRMENPDDSDTDRLFGMLSETAQRNVIHAVERKNAIDASRINEIHELLPDLTPMELEVSRLILRGMKLSQIAGYTGKSESNISVVRSRIRKKLELSPGDDLHEALLKLIRGGATESIVNLLILLQGAALVAVRQCRRMFVRRQTFTRCAGVYASLDVYAVCGRLCIGGSLCGGCLCGGGRPQGPRPASGMTHQKHLTINLNVRL